jgi:hypothetical protein
MLMPNDELELELLMNPPAPLTATHLETAAWGLSIRLVWTTVKGYTGWAVPVANLDSVNGVIEGWRPGKVPQFDHVPLPEYLKKLERLFGLT